MAFFLSIGVPAGYPTAETTPKADTIDLYAEALYQKKDQAEIPSSFESSARSGAGEPEEFDPVILVNETFEFEDEPTSPTPPKKRALKPAHSKKSRHN